MHTVASPFARAFAAAAILSCLAFATPSVAAPSATKSSSNIQNSGSVQQVASKSGKSSAGAEDPSMRIETRIQTLHDKLKITPDQESAWGEVAQSMRDSEQQVSQLAQDRHANAKSMTAVDDLESYQKIAQAHADGIKKVASSFQSLYDDMPDDQKKTADEVFGRFEGHRGGAKPASMSGGSMMGGSKMHRGNGVASPTGNLPLPTDDSSN